MLSTRHKNSLDKSLYYTCVQNDFQISLSFWPIFCPLTLLTTWKIKVLEKWKKTPVYIIILHLCTAHDDHTIYGSSNMVYNRENFLSFWTIFCSFTLLTTRKIKNFEKNGKMPVNVIILNTQVYHKWKSYDTWFLKYGA